MFRVHNSPIFDNQAGRAGGPGFPAIPPHPYRNSVFCQIGQAARARGLESPDEANVCAVSFDIRFRNPDREVHMRIVGLVHRDNAPRTKRR